MTKKLMSFLHRIFDKDPESFLAIRLNCNGTGLSWAIADGMLTTVPVGGTAVPLSVNLNQFTVATLATYLAAQTGYIVTYRDTSDRSLLGARVLMDGAADVSQSNGDHLNGYTSFLWSYLEANSSELQVAAQQIDNALLQMSTVTAEDVWLDELGAYYGVPRTMGELDAIYGPRIIAQVLRPLGNNVAIAAALQSLNNGLPATVDDYDHLTNLSYGLFDVNITVGLDQFQLITYVSMLASIVSTIDKMRDAGTFLRKVSVITRVTAPYYVASAVFSGETYRVYPSV